MGEFSLSKDVGITVKEAKKYIDDYLGKYEKIREFIQNTVACAEKDGFVKSLCRNAFRQEEIYPRNKVQKQEYKIFRGENSREQCRSGYFCGHNEICNDKRLQTA